MAARGNPFDQLAGGSGPIPNWLGVLTRREFFTDDLNFVAIHPPEPVDAEYLEWLDLIESVVSAGDDYSMIELGAGYGRWVVNGVAAVRALGRSRYRIVAVEPEPTHFRWLRQHCRDNRVRRRSRAGTARLVNAAVTAHGGPVDFGIGNPAGWYGQAVADGSWSPRETKRVPGIRLSSLLADLATVDFIHIDIQGAELEVMSEAAPRLVATVRRVHIGTHNATVEAGLRELFSGLGWECARDYACGSTSKTPYGEMRFQDGVQTWVNPRL